MDILFTAVTVGIGVLAIYLKLTTPERPAAPRRHKSPDHPLIKSMPAAGWDRPATRMPGYHAGTEEDSPAPPKAS